MQTPWLTIFSEACAIFSLLLATYLSFHKPSARFFALTLFLGGSAVEFPSIAELFSAAPDVVYVPATLLMYSLCASFPVLVLSSFAIRIGDRTTVAARRATLGRGRNGFGRFDCICASARILRTVTVYNRGDRRAPDSDTTRIVVRKSGRSRAFKYRCRRNTAGRCRLRRR